MKELRIQKQIKALARELKEKREQFSNAPSQSLEAEIWLLENKIELALQPNSKGGGSDGFAVDQMPSVSRWKT